MTTLPATTTDDGPDLGRLERQLRSMDTAVPPLRDARQVRDIAQQLVAPGKGILAADESDGTADKRLAAVGAATGPAGRRAYRQVLLGTADLGAHISGVILYDETIRQTAEDGTPFPSLLSAAGVLPGIKVDTGTVPLAGQPGQTVTKGLDGLRTRLADYTALGARFAKWRATFDVATGLSTASLAANAAAMAQYAALCHEAGVVPMVEPELLMDGDHDLDTAEQATTRILHAVYAAMFTHGVDLSGTLLKVNMVVPGTDNTTMASPAAVATATLRVLRRTVPADVPGVVFLSGGQSAVEATERLDAINRAAADSAPWRLSFSYARALQETVLTTWAGKDANVGAARLQLGHRAACNGAAAIGQYEQVMENEAALAGSG